MPIEIIIKTTEDQGGCDMLVIDGHEFIITELIKPSHVLDTLESLGYITIKIEEE